jgi:diguanylate cyclase (GGDEF)-like protein
MASGIPSKSSKKALDGESEWVRLGEAAARMGANPATLRRWADSGLLACRRSPGGQRLFSRDDVKYLVDGASTSPRVENTRSCEDALLKRLAQVTASSLDIEAVVTAVCEELGRSAPHEVAMLLVPAEGGARVCYRAPSGRGPAVGDALPGADAGCLRRLADRPIVKTTAAEQGLLPPGVVAELGVASLLFIALGPAEDLVGVLVLGSSDPDAFSDVAVGPLTRMTTHIGLAVHSSLVHKELKNAHLGSLMALSAALSAKDYYTLGHASRVAAYAVLLAKELGWSPESIGQLWPAAYLHDIGMIALPDRILVKAGHLSEKEKVLIRQHPAVSCEIIGRSFGEQMTLGVRHHHERFDGLGYPAGLCGEDIPAEARLLAVTDAYDAMSFDRSYRTARSYRECVAELQKEAGKQFDPTFVAAFLRVLKHLRVEKKRMLMVAREAAGGISVREHSCLRREGDERLSEYSQICAKLRAARDANPPTRFVTTHVLDHNRCLLVVDCEEDERLWSPIGTPFPIDPDIRSMADNDSREHVIVIADEFGVAVSGLARLPDSRGDSVVFVAADVGLPIPTPWTSAGASDMSSAFAGIMRASTERFTQARVDAVTDGVTSLSNRRHFTERLEDEVDQSLQTGAPLALLFCDIDYFKRFNDRYGHTAGDEALRCVARALRSCLRRADTAARYGGEEFTVALPETGLEGALLVAHRLRTAVEEASAALPGGRLTISVGLALVPDHASTAEALIERADQAMYTAKRHGRDRVEVASPR